MEHPDDEMFDDLHQGVFALRKVVESNDLSLSQEAAETLNRLEAVMPQAKTRWDELKSSIKDRAVQAAKKTDAAAKEHPWMFTFSALGLGLLAGLLLAGSDSE